MANSTPLAPVRLGPLGPKLPVKETPRPKRVGAKVVQAEGSIDRSYGPLDAGEEWGAALRAALGTSFRALRPRERTPPHGRIDAAWRIGAYNQQPVGCLGLDRKHGARK
jgi:hypothetical protein